MNMAVMAVLLLIFLLFGLQYHKMDITRITIPSAKITVPVRICVLADLHCRRFGEKQKRIMDIINREDPDMVVIPGDLFDLDRDYDISFELIDQLKGRWTAFCCGNHDIYLAEIGELCGKLREKGVHVLRNERVSFSDEIDVTGLEDRRPEEGLDTECCRALKEAEGFHIIISHRPDHAEAYRQISCDLIICGHMHGGQWRLPFTRIGLFGPHRTLLPKYTEGLHDLDGRLMFVSRGLASGDPHFFRLYNDPEIAFIDLQPKKDSS